MVLQTTCFAKRVHPKRPEHTPDSREAKWQSRGRQNQEFEGVEGGEAVKY